MSTSYWLSPATVLTRQLYMDSQYEHSNTGCQLAIYSTEFRRNSQLSAALHNLLYMNLVTHKGVGPGMTLAWPGWKQSDIAVEVDTGRLETSWFKKCYAICVLLHFTSTEFKSAFNVYWHGGGAAGLSCTELSIWEFHFLRGVCWQVWTRIWYCEKGMPQKDTLDNLRTPVCFRILSSSFTSVSIFSVSYYSIVSISVVTHNCYSSFRLAESRNRLSFIEPLVESQKRLFSLQRHNTKNLKQIFPEKELRGYNPNSYVHVSVSDLYIPWSVCLFSCRKIGGPNEGKSGNLFSEALKGNIFANTFVTCA